MLFKQAQIFKISSFSYSPEEVAQQLEPLAFTPCLRSHPETYGWVSPLENNDELLVREVEGNLMFCLQFEEKILPSIVVRQALQQKIKDMETQDNKKISRKHKNSLKDELIQTLLPQAFSKFSKLYAYIDAKHNWLIINTTNAKKTEKFLDIFHKSFGKVSLTPIKTVRIPYALTQWLIHQDYPNSFGVDKFCVLKDPQQSTRVIRCQQQDLSADPIQLILKDGCEVDKLSLSWQDQLNFTLSDNLLLNNIKFQEELLSQTKDMELETELQQFSANFLIMSKTFSELTKELLNLFEQKH